MKRLKRRAYELFVEPPEGDKLATGIPLAILVLIFFNVVISVAETEPTLAAAYPRFFFWFEVFSVAVFTIEYTVRLWACTEDPEYAGMLWGRLKMARSPMAIIDFLAIAPFYMQVFLPGLDLRFVRALRLFRLFRVFKVGRYAESFLTLVNVIKAKREELAISLVIVVITITLAASAMWLCESEAQPDNFRSVPAAMWWGIITITTIGYGDVYPITTAGKIVGGIVGFLGICIFALPVGILGSAFIDEVDRQKREKAKALAEKRKEDGVVEPDPTESAVECPHCGGAIQATFKAIPPGE